MRRPYGCPIPDPRLPDPLISNSHSSISDPYSLFPNPLVNTGRPRFGFGASLGRKCAGSVYLPGLQIFLELARPFGMAQAAQGLAFDLADALAGQSELGAHFLEGVGAPVF